MVSLSYGQACGHTVGFISEYGTGPEFDQLATETFEQAERDEEGNTLSWAVLVRKNFYQALKIKDPGRLHDALLRHVGYCLAWAEDAKASHEAELASKK
ncbi:hypothetical protein [Saccharopolyspora elongata]|uniref:Uncharacterized protein n=1 Tax=Saccharopolyspora elongata TaxID=2530387 RepID=A0A4R4Y6F5_9PSEU|nr:hypothetical protein [Saccharopolyspora elongata]TDD39856.1 hypothetical protein E1288_36170 [Saccharopolyspora elongata]